MLFSLFFVQEPELNEHHEPELNEHQEPEQTLRPPSPQPCPEEEDMEVDQAPKESVPVGTSVRQSFAPEGFTFQAPAGMSSFRFEPLTPRSADAFLTPRSVFFTIFKPFCSGSKCWYVIFLLSSSSFNLPASVVMPELQPEPSEVIPPKTTPTSPAVAPPTPGSSLESEHNVPYFRWCTLPDLFILSVVCFLKSNHVLCLCWL